LFFIFKSEEARGRNEGAGVDTVIITLISHLSSVICDFFNFSIFLASALSSSLG